jgi:hypothetical protein
MKKRWAAKKKATAKKSGLKVSAAAGEEASAFKT